LLIIRAQTRDYRTLEPIWLAAKSEFPTSALKLNRSHMYYRREVETRDCILLLRSYYDRQVADRARAQAAGDDNVEAIVIAALIRAAIVAHRENRVLDDPHPVPASGAGTRQEDAAWLIAVANAFNQSATEPALSDGITG
ncbi:MAG: DUF6545 domain-containing protein, partial [Actinomycetes bacterium]